MNNVFSNIVENLNIHGYQTEEFQDVNNDVIAGIINKFKNHPSILIIKQTKSTNGKLSLSEVDVIASVIRNLNIHKPTTFNNIPVKILVENCDISAKYIYKFFNTSVRDSILPENLKMAEITPVFKDNDKTEKKITDL